jgi:hypothetical protein
MPCDKQVKEDDLLLAYLYRGHVISVEVGQNLETLYWEAKGVIEPIKGGTSHTLSVSGAINPCKTKAEAKHAFLQQAKRIYNHIGS